MNLAFIHLFDTLSVFAVRLVCSVAALSSGCLLLLSIFAICIRPFVVPFCAVDFGFCLCFCLSALCTWGHEKFITGSGHRPRHRHRHRLGHRHGHRHGHRSLWQSRCLAVWRCQPHTRQDMGSGRGRGRGRGKGRGRGRGRGTGHVTSTAQQSW